MEGNTAPNLMGPPSAKSTAGVQPWAHGEGSLNLELSLPMLWVKQAIRKLQGTVAELI